MRVVTKPSTITDIGVFYLLTVFIFVIEAVFLNVFFELFMCALIFCTCGFLFTAVLLFYVNYNLSGMKFCSDDEIDISEVERKNWCMISETFCLSNLYKCAYVFLLRPRIDSGTFLDKKRKIICLKIKRRDGALRGSLVRSKKMRQMFLLEASVLFVIF